MSKANDLAVAALFLVGGAVGTSTKRNAIEEGFVDEVQVDPADFPFWQAFGVTAESVAAEFGQRITTYSVNLWGLTGPDTGTDAWTDLEAIIAAVDAWGDAGGLCDRVTATAWGVDEVSTRSSHTLAALTLEFEVHE